MPIKEGSWLDKDGFIKILSKTNMDKANVEPVVMVANKSKVCRWQERNYCTLGSSEGTWATKPYEG